MPHALQRFLLAEIGLFALGAIVHTSVSSHLHAKAATAETVIGVVLLAGLVGTFAAPARTRGIALPSGGTRRRRPGAMCSAKSIPRSRKPNSVRCRTG